MMKKLVCVLLCAVLALSLVACANNSTDDKTGDKTSSSLSSSADNANGDKDKAENKKNNQDKDDSNSKSSKTLVAYFSCTGNTAQMADYIASETDGELFAITPAKPYTAEDLDYNVKNCRANIEQRMPEVRVDIANKVANFDSYSTIYIGYPIWQNDAPKIIYTFLESYDFSGKTIIPFCTSASTDIADSEKNIKKLAPKAEWKKGKRFSPSALEKDIHDWLS